MGRAKSLFQILRENRAMEIIKERRAIEMSKDKALPSNDQIRDDTARSQEGSFFLPIIDDPENTLPERDKRRKKRM